MYRTVLGKIKSQSWNFKWFLVKRSLQFPLAGVSIRSVRVRTRKKDLFSVKFTVTSDDFSGEKEEKKTTTLIKIKYSIPSKGFFSFLLL